MRLFICALSVSLLFSCKASWHIKQAKRKDPTLFTEKVEIERDTVTLEVPTLVEKIKIDTLVSVVKVDPITKYKTVIKYKITKDTIMIDCPDSEVITETITKVETIRIEPTFWEKLQWFAYTLVGLVVFLGVRKLL